MRYTNNNGKLVSTYSPAELKEIRKDILELVKFDFYYSQLTSIKEEWDLRARLLHFAKKLRENPTAKDVLDARLLLANSYPCSLYPI
ncbi:hypothetical protein HY498_04935 [Candidatus Woesearchaeota archaeon]|nr:hypothetical protein [Candidatus Woesearchaeota archaeon]